MVVVGLLTWRRQRDKKKDDLSYWVTIVKNVGITFVGAVILWQVITTAARFIVEYWWFKDVGYPQIFITNQSYAWGLWIFGFVVSWVLLSVSQTLAKALVPGIPEKPTSKPRSRSGYYDSSNDQEDQYKRWPVIWNSYTWINRVCKLLFSVLFAWIASLQLNGTLQLLNMTNWGKTDPVFGLDYSFYVWQLPWLHTALGWLIGLLFVGFLFAVGTYAVLIRREEFFSRFTGSAAERFAKFTNAVIRHATLFVIGFCVLFAFAASLTPYDLLVNGSSSIISGAGWLDIVVMIPSLHFMVWVWVILAILAMVYLFMPRKKWLPIAGAAGWVVAWLIAIAIIPSISGIGYRTDTLSYEKPYIAQQIAGTRYAFDLNKIQEKGQLPYTDTVTGDQLKVSSPTLSQARIVDWQPLLLANNKLNYFLPYYNFVDVDVDRYGGKEYMVSVRELNTDLLPQNPDTTWVNDHFRYTHGYGYTIASVSDIDAMGVPVFVVKNIPPDGPILFQVDRPEVYFGEETKNFVIVGGMTKEFGKPVGTKVSEVTYDGPAGVQLGGFFQQLVFAIDQDDYRILFTNLIDANTKILYDRSLNQRMANLVGFLSCDKDPYAVLGGKEIEFMRDCYTRSDNLPYSAHLNGINYMRASVKGTIGAFTGETKFYVSDPSDPMIQTWEKIYPGVFTSMSAMPQYLTEHLRYPEDYLQTQADIYALYHITDPTAFYNHQIRWARAKEALTVGGESQPSAPRYVMMALPGSTQEEFIANVLFTPDGKQTLIAGLSARSDPGHYGEIVQYDFPTDQSVYGPQMVEARINQDGYLSQQLTLWNQQGSKVVWGQTIGLVVPAGDGVSVIYIRSLYLQSNDPNAPIPSIKLVIASQGNRLVYDTTLSGVLEQLYNGTPSTIQQPSTSVPTGSQAQLIQQALSHMDAAQKCAANGDWLCFGKEMDALKQTLNAFTNGQ
jgi:uncharacterized membrane protein (UPF0182 family)